jgi:sugar lactone lactonase YvrE
VNAGLEGTIPGKNAPFGGIAFDGLGDLYVVSGVYNNEIFVYAPGTTSPEYTIATPSIVDFIGIDSANNLYVLSGPPSAGTTTVGVYALGSGTPSYAFTATSSNMYLTAMAVDPSGTLYIGSYTGSVGSIAVYLPGSPSPSYSITTGSAAPTALGIDSRSILYAGDTNVTSLASSISVYASGKTVPSYRIKEAGGSNPISFAFDSKDNLYVANFGTGVSIYASGTSNLVRQLPLKTTFGVAIGR